MWRRVHLPSIDGPLLGFTMPHEDVLFALVPGGLVRIGLDPVDVHLVAGRSRPRGRVPPGGARAHLGGRRHLVYDADGGNVTLCDHPNGDRITLDADGTLVLTNPTERVVRQRLESVRLPDDGSWMYAGFSEDFRWLVAGGAAGLQVFREERKGRTSRFAM